MREARGFTLIEVMVAMVVLAIAALGASSALIAAAKQVKDGQLQQYKVALAEAHGRTWALADKGLIATRAVAWPGSAPDSLPLTDTTTWKLDTSTPSQVTSSPPTFADPLGAGAFFTINERGAVAPVWPVPTYSSTDTCLTVSVATGTLCRQVAVVKGLPDGNAPPNGTAYTIWTRVHRVGDSIINDVVHREVIVE